MMRKVTLAFCLLVFALAIGYPLISPGFMDSSRVVTGHYLSQGLAETMSPNIVNAIVWDYRSFDTLGEEIVLLTAAMGVFTVMVFGISEKGKEKEKIGR